MIARLFYYLKDLFMNTVLLENKEDLLVTSFGGIKKYTDNPPVVLILFKAPAVSDLKRDLIT